MERKFRCGSVSIGYRSLNIREIYWLIFLHRRVKRRAALLERSAGAAVVRAEPGNFFVHAKKVTGSAERVRKQSRPALHERLNPDLIEIEQDSGRGNCARNHAAISSSVKNVAK